MKTKLKPCPFCGRINTLDVYEIPVTYPKKFNVECVSNPSAVGCGTVGPEADSMEAAIRAWNRRSGGRGKKS